MQIWKLGMEHEIYFMESLLSPGPWVRLQRLGWEGDFFGSEAQTLQCHIFNSLWNSWFSLSILFSSICCWMALFHRSRIRVRGDSFPASFLLLLSPSTAPPPSWSMGGGSIHSKSSTGDEIGHPQWTLVIRLRQTWIGWGKHGSVGQHKPLMRSGLLHIT